MRDRAERGGRARLHPLGEERTDATGEHVAGSGGCERRGAVGGDENPFARRGDERVGAFQHHGRPETRGGPAHRLEAMGVDLPGVGREQSGELAGVRGHHCHGGPLERLERPERVGVEHHGSPELLEEHPHEVARPVAAAETRPEHDRVRAFRSLEHRVGGAWKQPAGRVLGERPLDGFEYPRLDRRKCRLGRGNGDVPGIGTERGEGRQGRRPGLPGRAADDEHRAGTVFVALGGLAGDGVECRGLYEPVLERDGLEPDRRHVNEACVKPSGSNGETDLRRAERDGRLGPHGRAGHLACRGVHAGGNVDRDDRLAGGVDPLDHPRHVLAGSLVEADPEQRVDDHVRVAEVAERLDENDLTSAFPENPRADPAVAAVVTAAAQHRDPARVALHHDVRDGHPGPLHQLFHRPLVGLLGAARLGGGEERERVHQAATTTATAAASSRECVIESSIAPAPVRSAKAAVRPVR